MNMNDIIERECRSIKHELTQDICVLLAEVQDWIHYYAVKVGVYVSDECFEEG